METVAKRTLVKSAPELWELADDLLRMETWLRDVAGGPVDVVEVTERKPEEILIWRSSGATIALELEEGTFGTAVEIKAQHESSDRNCAEAALDRLLDELGSPERRPFARG
jgi:hypothetical protein